VPREGDGDATDVTDGTSDGVGDGVGDADENAAVRLVPRPYSTPILAGGPERAAEGCTMISGAESPPREIAQTVPPKTRATTTPSAAAHRDRASDTIGEVGPAPGAACLPT